MTQVLRPTSSGQNKQQSEWLLQGEWGKREYPSMHRTDLYRLIERELVEAGVLPADQLRNSFQIWSTVVMCSWVDGKWVLDSHALHMVTNLPNPD